LRFGTGRHPARLNCGDCASYALAKQRRIKLLFKGADFTHTDITPALPAA
jgi:ribonuclease VapC